MNEQEWLSSSDPAAMLRFCGNNLSPRRLRLFATACCRSVWHLLTDDAECPDCRGKGVSNPSGLHGGLDTCRTCNHIGRINRSRRAVEVAERYADGGATDRERLDALCGANEVYRATDHSSDGDDDYLAWHAVADASSCCDNPTEIAASNVASRPSVDEAPALLRCIAGNPHEPVSLCGNPDYGSVTVRPYCPACQRLRTPTVLALADATYRNRLAGRVCERCGGDGEIHDANFSVGDSDQQMILKQDTLRTCPDCHGSGRIGDGRLDPDRLGVLADALEDAGCQADVACPKCSPNFKTSSGFGLGWLTSGGNGSPVIQVGCTDCGGTLTSKVDGGRDGTGRIPNHLIAHLRSPGPHVMGCHALDLIRGKS